jgi:hypothetical protein
MLGGWKKGGHTHTDGIRISYYIHYRCSVVMIIWIPFPFMMGMGLKFELMGLSGTQNFFISNFQMNKILFHLQILSLSWLFIKSNLSTFSRDRCERLSSNVLIQELKFLSDSNWVLGTLKTVFATFANFEYLIALFFQKYNISSVFLSLIFFV